MRIDHLRADIRFAFRSLKRAPGFTAVALTTLVVGIASVTSLFSLVYAYAFRPLPYKDAERIVSLHERRAHTVRPNGVSIDAARAIVTGGHSFERIALFETGSTRGSLAGQTIDVQTLWVDSSFMALFAMTPQRGRTLTSDEILNDAPSIMISDVLWRTKFGAEPSAVGRTVRLGSELLTIVGIMPPRFRFPNQTDIWRPLRRKDGVDPVVTLLAKLKPGVRPQAIEPELALIAKRLAQSDAERFAGATISAEEMINRGVGGGVAFVWLFMAAAVAVLLIACANVGNLMLVRAAERRSEMAIRASLGAGRRRLLTQALMESIVLATLAGVLGSMLSLALVKLGLAVIPSAGFPSWLTFGLDSRILIFTVGLLALVTVAVGLTPAREGTRFDLARALKAGGDAGTSSSGVTKRAQRGIVVQLSLSVVLFIGALLLVQTYRQLAIVDMGYAADEIVQLTPYFDAERYSNDTSTMHFVSEVLASVTPLVGPGRAAIRGFVDLEALSAIATTANGRGANVRRGVELVTDGDSARTRGTLRSLYPYPRYFAVSHEYFQTLDLKVVRGRSFAPDDAPGSQKVVVVSRHFADAFWPRENPIGHTVQFGPHGTHVIVIGVVEDVRDVQGGPRGVHVSARPDAYFSAGQVKVWQPEILLHASGSVTALQREVQVIARRVDPDVSTTAYTMARAVETERFVAKLFGSVIGGFAISGLILSIIGIYGIVAYGITQRTREIGIRIALGGTSRDVMRLVLRQALRFVGVGLAAGVVLSFGTSRLLRVLLFGVSATDPLTYAAACIIFGGVGLLACYVPARRVTRIDPLVALRTE